MTKPFDVIVIGGGATGAGIARDCARRGIRVLLIERFDISTGDRDEITVCCIVVPAMQ